jgi:heterogeneous nuclear ribonucleoprotein R
VLSTLRCLRWALWFRGCFHSDTRSLRFSNREVVSQDQHDPNRNRGFLFVEYYNHACADYAKQKLSSPNFKVDGSQLTVSWAEPKGSTDASSAAAQVRHHTWTPLPKKNNFFTRINLSYHCLGLLILEQVDLYWPACCLVPDELVNLLVVNEASWLCNLLETDEATGKRV